MNGVEGGDVTRASFEPFHHYSGVRAQQGRVQLDADWNEQLDIGAHRDRVGALDTIGVSGAPKADSGFHLELTPDGTDLVLTPGRMWVDGTVCELDASDTAATISGATVVVATAVLDGLELSPGEWVELFGAGRAVGAGARHRRGRRGGNAHRCPGTGGRPEPSAAAPAPLLHHPA